MNWSEKIEKLMKQRNWSQKDLAKNSGITEASVSRYINGERKPRVDIVINFAKAFGVSTDYLLYDDDEADKKRSAFENISAAIARNGENLTADEQNRLIKMILNASGAEDVQKS